MMKISTANSFAKIRIDIRKGPSFWDYFGDKPSIPGMEPNKYLLRRLENIEV